MTQRMRARFSDPVRSRSRAFACRSVLKPNGVFLIISYGQPDNRLSYLEKEEYGWTVDVQTVRTCAAQQGPRHRAAR